VISNNQIVLDLVNEAATARLAAALALRVQKGDILLLSGALGSGKTSFARAFIRALGDPDQEVPSPTFTLVETYIVPNHPPIWHFDLYRLEHPEEVYELGIEEAWTDGISLIEWPERIASLLPAERLDIMLAAGTDPGARRAVLKGSGGWASRLQGLDHV